MALENKLISKNQMNLVFAGHVDHGKSTIVGRLLADTDSLPEGKLEQIRENCKRNSKPFEYAFLIDALKDEQSQGITIDSARVFFNTENRNYVIIDAPGHIEFLKNMVTGASRAEAAMLVIDAKEGVQENSRRHGYMLGMLGIKQIAVMVNKMDLINYDKQTYENIVTEYSQFLRDIEIEPDVFVPVSGMEGDNVASLSSNTPWYKGKTVLGVLDSFQKEEEREGKPFRMPVQDVYKFTNFGDSRRLISGTVETGKLTVGEEVIFYPSGKRSTVKSIERFNSPEIKTTEAGWATSFTLSEQIYIRRGELAVKRSEPAPSVSSRIRVNLFWLRKNPMVKEKDYLLKVGTVKVPLRLEEIVRVIDASTLGSEESKERIDRHDVAEVIFSLKKPIAFDTSEEIAQTSRFVVVDDYEISGGGIIREGLSDKQTDIRDKVFLRNYKWEKSFIPKEARAEKYSQKPMLLLVTGQKDVGKKEVAKRLEENLFRKGRMVYYLGIGNILYGIDADIKTKQDNRSEHMRRLAEVSHLMMDAGLILVVTAVELSQDDLEIIKTVIDPDRIETLWIGEKVTTDVAYDYHFLGREHVDEIESILVERLQDKGVLFKPW